MTRAKKRVNINLLFENTFKLTSGKR